MIMSTQRIQIGVPAEPYSHDTSPHESLGAFFAHAFDLHRLLGEYIRHRAIRRAEKELMALDNRMLKDIGLDRSEIGSAVRNPRQERLNGAQLTELLTY